MKHFLLRLMRSKAKQSVVGLFAMLLIALSGNGCSSSHKRILHEPPEDILPTQPIYFLTGPIAALLTNSTGFSAHITIDPPVDAKSEHGFTGQLLGKGSYLLLAPTKGDRVYIWNVADGTGYVLSDALQGYASFSSSVHVAEITTISETAGPASERVNNHPGHEGEVVVRMDDGTTNRFSLWHMMDYGGFPDRIKAVNSAAPMVVNLTGFKLETLHQALFLPPEGFTRYPKPKAMADELMSRKSKMRNGGTENDNDDLPAGVAKRPKPTY